MVDGVGGDGFGFLIVGSLVGLDVGDVVGNLVGYLVGLDVGFNVGYLVGFEVGFEVGYLVGSDVGFDVGSTVGRKLGRNDGYPVGESVTGSSPTTVVGDMVGMNTTPADEGPTVGEDVYGHKSQVKGHSFRL